jgi:hypothetical protein
VAILERRNARRRLLKEDFLHYLFVFWIEKMAMKHGNDPDGRSDVWRRCRGSIGYFFRDLTDDGNGRWPLSRSESSFVHIPFPSNAPFCVRLVGCAQMAACLEKDHAE